MRIGVYLPFAVAAVLAVLASRLAKHLTPRAATLSLAGSALVASVSWLGALALLAFSGFGQIPVVALVGSWSTSVLEAEDPVARTVAGICAVVLLATTVALGLASWRRGRLLVAAFQECHRLPGDGELAVIDDARLEAFALPGLPGRRGRVVVSTGMLRTLQGAEREALMAHERAHLRGHHHLYLLVLQLAAAACPLLRPLAKEGAFTIERWADEDAALAVGDRAVVARALSRAALAKKGSHSHLGTLAAVGGPVPRRVRALLAPSPKPRTTPLIVFALLLALCCGGLAQATQETQRMFDGAQDAYAASR